MTVTRIGIDDGDRERVMAVAKVRTTTEAVDVALDSNAEQQERAVRISRHFDRARAWGAVEDAERAHRKEKHGRCTPLASAPAGSAGSGYSTRCMMSRST
jgi:hypothetical protein